MVVTEGMRVFLGECSRREEVPWKGMENVC